MKTPLLLNSVFKNLKDYDTKKNNPTEKLSTIFKELQCLRNKIKGSKIDNCDLKQIKSDLKKQIEEFDILKHESNLSSFEETKLKSTDFYIQSLSFNAEIQTLINRIAHKLNKKDNEKLRSDYQEKQKKLEETSNDIKIELKEVGKLKENVLTISSLVFSGFTLIQLNFLAFGQSNEYSIIDRLILFAGINIFLLLALYTIFSLIRNIISSENNLDIKLKCRVGIPILLLMFFLSLLYKHRFIFENINQQNFKIHQTKYENLVNKEVLSIKNLKETSTNLQQRFKDLETDIKSLKYENYKKELEILTLKDKIESLEQKVKDKETKRSNINIGIENTSKSKSLILKSE